MEIEETLSTPVQELLETIMFRYGIIDHQLADFYIKLDRIHIESAFLAGYLAHMKDADPDCDKFCNAKYGEL